MHKKFRSPLVLLHFPAHQPRRLVFKNLILLHVLQANYHLADKGTLRQPQQEEHQEGERRSAGLILSSSLNNSRSNSYPAAAEELLVVRNPYCLSATRARQVASSSSIAAALESLALQELVLKCLLLLRRAPAA